MIYLQIYDICMYVSTKNKNRERERSKISDREKMCQRYKKGLCVCFFK